MSQKRPDPLKDLRVATPCPADWESMAGDDRRRFCGQCELNVYNLSGMTSREAVELINRTEGRLCVRFFRRADGTVLTKNCPVGLRALKRRVSKIATATLSAVLGFFSGLGIYTAAGEPEPEVTGMVMRPAIMGGIMDTAEPLPPAVVFEVPEGGQYEVGKLPVIPTKESRKVERGRRSKR